jgi:hypothetical protein
MRPWLYDDSTTSILHRPSLEVGGYAPLRIPFALTFVVVAWMISVVPSRSTRAHCKRLTSYFLISAAIIAIPSGLTQQMCDHSSRLLLARGPYDSEGHDE